MKALRIKYAMYKKNRDNSITYVDIDGEFTDSDVFAEKFRTKKEAQSRLDMLNEYVEEAKGTHYEDFKNYDGFKVCQVRTVLIEEVE